MSAPAAVPEEADVVVVGGGIMGLATAWNLAKLGVKRIVVVEKSYLCSGASGRNGGGVRAQWSSETNVRLMKDAVAGRAQVKASGGIKDLAAALALLDAGADRLGMSRTVAILESLPE